MTMNEKIFRKPLTSEKLNGYELVELKLMVKMYLWQENKFQIAKKRP